MASNPRGIPAVASALIRPTASTPTPPEPAEAEAVVEAEEGRGVSPEVRPRAARRRPSKTFNERTTARKLVLPDGVYDRLQLLAIQRRTTASAIAADILDKNLPRLRIERDA